MITEEDSIKVLEGDWNPLTVVKEIVEDGKQDDAFYVMDLGEVVARYHHWKELMPRIKPYYAVKCNDNKLLVTTLAALGTGFDCASRAEIELVTSIGVRPERIIYANPAKIASHIKYASRMGVDTMTFDSKFELKKIKQLMPHAQLVIRIRCDAASALHPLGNKFGCDPVTEAPRLLKQAAALGLDVIGVSFHVGSNVSETDVYLRAIQYCRALFTLGASVGHSRMTLLDIGGGFPGHRDSSIREVSLVINSALETYFGDANVRVIAEPGRYFADAALTLAALVHAKRELPAKEDEEAHTMYFMNDGVYGSFNCVLYYQQQVLPQPLMPTSAKPQPCSLWGPTCDGLDCVLPHTMLPPLETGAWLVFRDMGAYTLPVASLFNGFPRPRVRAVMDRRVWLSIKNRWPFTESHFEMGSRMTGTQMPRRRRRASAS